MMHEGTQYTRSCRRVPFINALCQKMFGPNPEKVLSVMDSRKERTLRLRDSKHRLRHRTRTV
jgi:hypothetical protein